MSSTEIDVRVAALLRAALDFEADDGTDGRNPIEGLCAAAREYAKTKARLEACFASRDGMRCTIAGAHPGRKHEAGFLRWS